MATAARCPIDPARDDRKTVAAYDQANIFKHGAEVVRSADGVKGVLRAPALLQDALDAEFMKSLPEDQVPLIFLDGKPHRGRRSLITDYFSPRTIREKFEPLMERTADMLIADLRRQGQLRVDEASCRWQ